MAESEKPAAKTLFNNPTLSDVKIKQTCNGQTHEYYAHKAVLCTQSTYFMNAFSGSFREATESTMELYDDHPEHFAFALKFMYTLEYDITAIGKIASANDELERMQFALGVNIVGDKYDIYRLISPILYELRPILRNTSSHELLKSTVHTYYKLCRQPGEAVGNLIVSTILRKHLAFRESDTFDDLVRSVPFFAADIALDYQRDKLFGVRRISCCKRVNIVLNNPRGIYTRLNTHCPYCGQAQIISANAE
ncbi:hypothetical protein EJ02DRAFT_513888 [Clathrospora elynae]|uniref:BTB domain-containing protein n=1 Tax=Clathrospora elynae TaxID=706981 RepID=A0A6A5SH53_9PLEO|nr:hypothetical protein EJ02DRAFT_513888 [Clathrospora elynae]